ncbi:MAG: anthranilate synthase [delta proteobacterium ML8_F1]|nr:MAG: anthranilate synthase [delta proteobacterium ML8_F1]
MILLIDNYDSFTYNLYQYLLMLGETVTVVRNDEITLEEIRRMAPLGIILSPGPGTPGDSGICQETVTAFAGKIPILGVCLGHQTIAERAGAKIVTAVEPVHGKVHAITHNGKGVFKNLRNPLKVTRYHSLVVDPETLPGAFEVTAMTREGEIMGLRHLKYPLEGVQFHPEAILTEQGHELLKNFIDGAKEWTGDV